MNALAIIGWAFIAGLALVAFLVPLYIADVISKSVARPSATDSEGHDK